MNIKESISVEQVGIILGSKDTQLAFLLKMESLWGVPTKINRKGVRVVDVKSVGNVSDFIVKKWDYNQAKDVLREMFKNTEKYLRGKTAKTLFNKVKEKYNQLGYTDYNWPFVSGQFDAYAVKMVVYPSVGDLSKLDDALIRVQDDVEKFAYLKIFNTLRNDYIEYLIFNADEDIIPTFSHKGGIDFFIHGIGFDQKVSRSVTTQFVDKYGENWRDTALKNPYEVAKFLMELGDEARFSNVPRLFVIDVDGTYELDNIEEKVNTISFDEPHTVKYTYKHSSTGLKDYECPVICLMLTQ